MRLENPLIRNIAFVGPAPHVMTEPPRGPLHAQSPGSGTAGWSLTKGVLQMRRDAQCICVSCGRGDKPYLSSATNRKRALAPPAPCPYNPLASLSYRMGPGEPELDCWEFLAWTMHFPGDLLFREHSATRSSIRQESWWDCNG
ncbi:hypothetical protein SKAU_G00023780 [Synaphobranchus kaupii]|uniref:Uncharacterized protein n=1 Tax=Synaphobranchus kaupii TaxID=118154 RepID=A0A9Q1JE61_SYNKA|nr:hypothetical protein SKAU_G00023780 [Synaphobranchus kaupii]